MYYSNGNYEAFARPKKPEIVDDKSAYIVGSGLAALSTAVFLVRDAQMPGDHIHILEELSLPGGSMDGIKNDRLGYIIRGGVKWNLTLKCSGTYSAPFLPLKIQTIQSWMNSTGSTKKTLVMPRRVSFAIVVKLFLTMVN